MGFTLPLLRSRINSVERCALRHTGGLSLQDWLKSSWLIEHSWLLRLTLCLETTKRMSGQTTQLRGINTQYESID